MPHRGDPSPASASAARIGGALAALLMAMLWTLALAPAGPALAQTAAPAPSEPAPDRSATGGAQTLEDILARQRGETVRNDFRKTPGRAARPAEEREMLGVLGPQSDAEVFRALRFGTAEVLVSTNKPVDEVLVQDGGMRWLQWRDGPLIRYGLWALGGMAALLVLFYLLRGRIRIDGGRAGVTVPRFNIVERGAHWLLAGSFLILALTGLTQLMGRKFLLPLIGLEPFAAVAALGKLLHNAVAWGFMAALVVVFLLWVSQNLPSRDDLRWLAMGGGFFGGGHPPSRKFNAGQKMIFWSVTLIGGLISLTGLSLLFPFQLPMASAVFAVVNDIAALAGWAPGLPVMLAPQEDMQYAQLAHAAAGFVLLTIIIAHIYIGSVGMEGGFEAMGSGRVDRNWAEAHHNLWLQELDAEAPAAKPDDAAADEAQA